VIIGKEIGMNLEVGHQDVELTFSVEVKWGDRIIIPKRKGSLHILDGKTTGKMKIPIYRFES
jgi:hypothetical protein